MRVAWVHPTWRDLVIERLAGDPPLRRRFLARCGVHGIVLAVSVAGGAGGQRRLPLLGDDADWDTAGDRLYALVPELETGELVVLLEALAVMIDELDPAVGGSEPQALARLALSRVAGLWDAARDPVPLPALGAWLRLAGRLEPPPEPPSLAATWAELLPARIPGPDDVAEVQRLTDWLILCRLLPDPARVALGWGPDHMDRIAEFVDRAAADPGRYATDPVVGALDAAAQLYPDLAGRARRVTVLLLKPEMSKSWGDPPEPIDAPALVEGFDIDRVLADL
jgi:hypothetical protein